VGGWRRQGAVGVVGKVGGLGEEWSLMERDTRSTRRRRDDGDGRDATVRCARKQWRVVREAVDEREVA
jgi:hypothetical protein